jgi:hypothetical protein
MNLGLNEQQPTLAANSLAPIRPAYATERFRLLLVFPPETSSDPRAENTDSDVQHVPVIGPHTGNVPKASGLCLAGRVQQCNRAAVSGDAGGGSRLPSRRWIPITK